MTASNPSTPRQPPAGSEPGLVERLERAEDFIRQMAATARHSDTGVVPSFLVEHWAKDYFDGRK